MTCAFRCLPVLDAQRRLIGLGTMIRVEGIAEIASLKKGGFFCTQTDVEVF